MFTSQLHLYLRVLSISKVKVYTTSLTVHFDYNLEVRITKVKCIWLKDQVELFYRRTLFIQTMQILKLVCYYFELCVRL